MPTTSARLKFALLAFSGLLTAATPLPSGVLAAAETPAPAGSPAQPSPGGGLAGVRFNTTALDMKEYMGHVVDPAAFAYWKRSGVEVTAKGERDLTPTTKDGWEDLESAAAILVEAGNSLQLPGRARAPENEFHKFAQQLTDEAILAKVAAQQHDRNGIYVEGARIYQICSACHQAYVIEPDLQAHGPAQGRPLPAWPADVQSRQRAYMAKRATAR